MTVILLSYCVVFAFLNLFYEDIRGLFTEKSRILFNYFDVFLLILFCLSISTLFESFLRARYDTVVTNVVNGVSNRILTAYKNLPGISFFLASGFLSSGVL